MRGMRSMVSRHLARQVRDVARQASVLAMICSGCATTGAKQRSGAPEPRAERPTTQPTNGEVDPWRDATALIQRPPIKPTGAIDLPRRERFELPNGLSVMLVPDSTLPLVEVGLHLRVGSIDEPADKIGLAAFTASMLRQGVRGLDADAISERVDAAGASLEASSGYELSQVNCAGRAQTLSLCLDLVARLVSQPSFPRDEMTEIRQRLLSQVRQLRDNPHALAAEHFHNLLYGDDHPAGRPMTEQTVRAIDREDIVRFHQQRFVPEAAVLVVAGQIDVDRLRKRLPRAFARWRARRGRSRWVRAVANPARGLHVLLVDKPDLSQSFFALGHAGVSLRHPERDALRVANFVLGGGGFSSRLMEKVRSEGGKTYGISSQFASHDDDGHFVVGSFTRNDQIVATLRLVRQELERIREHPPSREEIVAAKGKIAGGYALSFPTPADLAGALARARLRGLPETYVSELSARVESSSEAEVAEAARAHIHPDRLLVAIVGKAEVVAPLLEAAKIAFRTISYRAPISARARNKVAASARRSGAEGGGDGAP